MCGEAAEVDHADKSALYFKLVLNKTLTYKGNACAGSKRSEERIPVIMRRNATGSERCRLLVIGKAAKPRCFKGIKTLPVDYTSNKKSWMMREIFTDWLCAIDRKFAAQNRNVLMFVVNCPAHCDVSGLKAIRLALLSKNTTAVLQPMDRGVIQNLKTLYRCHLLGRILSLDSAMSYDVNLLGAIHMLATSWNSIKQETVVNCFRKCGFSKAPEACNLEALCEDDSVMLDSSYAALSEGVDFKSYVDVDSDVETSGPLSDADIIEAACCEQTSQGSRAPNSADSGNRVQLRQRVSATHKCMQSSVGAGCCSMLFLSR